MQKLGIKLMWEASLEIARPRISPRLSHLGDALVGFVGDAMGILGGNLFRVEVGE